MNLAEVTNPPIEYPDSEEERYTNGDTKWWRWYAATRLVNKAGFISRGAVNKLLGYKPNYVMKGFGTRKSGLKEITEAEHQAILSSFLRSHSKADIKLLERDDNWGAGGEGPVHLALKKWVADHPEDALGEPGVKTIEVEYQFGSTGDRIDVLLQDSLGRYIAVEIEPACDKNHDSGPLQCMKYRSLLAYRMARNIQEVRTCLIAHSIHPQVASKAQRYGIECVEIDPKFSKQL